MPSLPSARHVHRVHLDDVSAASLDRQWVHIVNNGLGEPIRVPVVVVRGAEDGPILGLTAAVHGNELNGLAVLQRLIEEVDPAQMRGTIVMALAVNVPGVLLGQRGFNDGADLNRTAPGKPSGTSAEIYIHRVIDRIVSRVELLIDLHTASMGRVNSFYVRANMHNPRAARLARLQNPDIIVHNPPGDTTLRGAASAMGIPSVTAELRDPNKFQADVIAEELLGLRNVLVDLGMIEGRIADGVQQTILCDGSGWMYTDEGGILEVLPQVTQRVRAGETIARVRTIFGDITREWTAPAEAVVVGRSVNPINQTGSRIVHLGWNPRPMPPNGLPA